MSSPKVDIINAANFISITSVYSDYKANSGLFAPIIVMIIPTIQIRLLENILTTHRLNALTLAMTVH